MNKFAEIEKIINDTLIEIDGNWLGLEDQLCMAQASPDNPWKAMDVAEILEKIAQRDAKIAAVIA